MISPHRETAGRCKIHDDEFELLASAVRPGSRVLEIGTLDGVTASLLARRQPTAVIVSVDVFRQVTPEKWFANRRPNMRLVVGSAPNLVASVGTRPGGMVAGGWFDVIFVDGDHHYGACLADLAACDILLARDGRLFLHDCGRRPGVDQALTRFLEGGRFLCGRRVGTLQEVLRQ